MRNVAAECVIMRCGGKDCPYEAPLDPENTRVMSELLGVTLTQGSVIVMPYCGKCLTGDQSLTSVPVEDIAVILPERCGAQDAFADPPPTVVVRTSATAA